MQAESENKPAPAPKKTALKFPMRGILLTALFAIILKLSFFDWKLWGVYQHVQVIEQKAGELQALITPDMGLEQAPLIAPQVHDLRADLNGLQIEALPYLWLTKYNGWIPKYAGTKKLLSKRAESRLNL